MVPPVNHMPRRDASLIASLFDHQGYVRWLLYRALAKCLRARQSSGRESVLDVGCGDRPYEALVKSCGFQYIAADLDGVVDVKIIPGQAFPISDSSVDGVLSVQVLEHVWDVPWYLAECRRVMKPNAWLMLSTHGTWLYHPHPSDYRRWTADGLKKELAAAGFDVVLADALMGPLTWTTQFRLLGYDHVLAKIPILRHLCRPLISLVMSVRMILEEAITPESIRKDNASIYLTICGKAKK